MIWFPERKQIEKMYYQWLEDNPTVKDSPFNVITFLEINGLLKGLNEDNANNIKESEEYIWQNLKSNMKIEQSQRP